MAVLSWQVFFFTQGSAQLNEEKYDRQIWMNMLPLIFLLLCTLPGELVIRVVSLAKALKFPILS